MIYSLKNSHRLTTPTHCSIQFPGMFKSPSYKSTNLGGRLVFTSTQKPNRKSRNFWNDFSYIVKNDKVQYILRLIYETKPFRE